MRGIGATDKDTAYRGVKRGRKLSAYELQMVAKLPRTSGRQSLSKDVTTGYQYEWAMNEQTREWLEKHS